MSATWFAFSMVTDLPYVKVITRRQNRRVVIFLMYFDFLLLKVSLILSDTKRLLLQKDLEYRKKIS